MTINKSRFVILAVVLIFGMMLIACDNDCAHNWEWRLTTPVTQISAGLETETCTTCGFVNRARSLPAIGNEDLAITIPDWVQGIWYFPVGENMVKSHEITSSQLIQVAVVPGGGRRVGDEVPPRLNAIGLGVNEYTIIFGMRLHPLQIRAIRMVDPDTIAIGFPWQVVDVPVDRIPRSLLHHR